MRNAREWMRRGFEPDLARWASAASGAWFMGAVTWGASAHRFRGPQRWARLVGLRVGLVALQLHRRAWAWGVLR